MKSEKIIFSEAAEFIKEHDNFLIISHISGPITHRQTKFGIISNALQIFDRVQTISSGNIAPGKTQIP